MEEDKTNASTTSKALCPTDYIQQHEHAFSLIPSPACPRVCELTLHRKMRPVTHERIMFLFSEMHWQSSQ